MPLFIEKKLEGDNLSSTELELQNSVVNKLFYLNNNDFINGTYRITSPGYYKLSENIIFSPNSNNNGKPTPEQLKCLPKSFILGFFAAITIETENVILDLNNFSIRQSEIHFVQQTFYSHIELASSPFVKLQGPANFGNDIKFGKNITIKNGILGLSSHHGIHGNGNSNVIIKDLLIKDYGVAAIALNGGNNLLICNINIDNSNINIPFNSLLSHSLFILPFLSKLNKRIPNDKSFFNHKEKTVQEIFINLNNEINKAFESIKLNTSYEGIFKNDSSKYDANIYGIVLNSIGVVVNDFKPLRDDETFGNENIVLEKITMTNIISNGNEIKLLSNYDMFELSQGYGSKNIFQGPVGDIFNWQACINQSGKYISNVVSDAQLTLANFGINDELGRTFIPKELILWAQGNSSIYDLINLKQFFIIGGGDSMAHIMKGNIGLFISQGNKIIIDKLTIDTIINNSESQLQKVNSSFGILFTGSKNITLSNYIIKNIISKQNNQFDIAYKTSNENIKIL